MSDCRNVDLRRWVLSLSFAGILIAFFGKACDAKAVSQTPPNIVVYISDDHSQCDSSLYGNSKIPTPNFEELAGDGMTFTHAFVASPSCAPSRAAMLTGLMPARNGAEANHTHPPDGTHVLIQDLQELGYEVAALGKVAHGKDKNRYGFNVTKRANKLNRLRGLVRDYLGQRESAKPLCLFVGVSEPHVPWSIPLSFDPNEVGFPPVHLDTPKTRQHRAAYYEEVRALDAFLGELRKIVSQSLGSDVLFIHTSDHGSQWPFGKWTLYDYGTRVPFIASWPDVIEPDTRTDAMISWVDLLPTLIDLAGGKPPVELDGRSFSAVLRGDEDSHREFIFTTHSGDGSMNVYPSRSVRSQDWKLIHNLHPEFVFTNHSDILRKPGAGGYWGEWLSAAASDTKAKAIVDRYYLRPEYELYHLKQDPWEEHNLAGEERYREKLENLKLKLAKWMETQGDGATIHGNPRLASDDKSWPPEYQQATDSPRTK